MKNHILSLSLACCLALLCTGLKAQNAFDPVKDEAALKAKMKEVAESTQTMTCDFAQEKHLSFMSMPIVSNGKMVVKHPGKLRWEYVTPYSYILVINDGTMSMRDEGNDSEIDLSESEGFKQMNNTILSIMQGELTDIEGFESGYFENDENYKIGLVPTQDQVAEFIQKIEVYIEKQDMNVFQVHLHEASGDETRMYFKDHVINAEVSEDQFVIK